MKEGRDKGIIPPACILKSTKAPPEKANQNGCGVSQIDSKEQWTRRDGGKKMDTASNRAGS